MNTCVFNYLSSEICGPPADVFWRCNWEGKAGCQNVSYLQLCSSPTFLSFSFFSFDFFSSIS